MAETMLNLEPNPDTRPPSIAHIEKEMQRKSPIQTQQPLNIPSSIKTQPFHQLPRTRIYIRSPPRRRGQSKRRRER